MSIDKDILIRAAFDCVENSDLKEYCRMSELGVDLNIRHPTSKRSIFTNACIKWLRAHSSYIISNYVYRDQQHPHDEFVDGLINEHLKKYGSYPSAETVQIGFEIILSTISNKSGDGIHQVSADCMLNTLTTIIQKCEVEINSCIKKIRPHMPPLFLTLVKKQIRPLLNILLSSKYLNFYQRIPKIEYEDTQHGLINQWVYDKDNNMDIMEFTSYIESIDPPDLSTSRAINQIKRHHVKLQNKLLADVCIGLKSKNVPVLILTMIYEYLRNPPIVFNEHSIWVKCNIIHLA